MGLVAWFILYFITLSILYLVLCKWVTRDTVLDGTSDGDPSQPFWNTSQPNPNWTCNIKLPKLRWIFKKVSNWVDTRPHPRPFLERCIANMLRNFPVSKCSHNVLLLVLNTVLEFRFVRFNFHSMLVFKHFHSCVWPFFRVCNNT